MRGITYCRQVYPLYISLYLFVRQIIKNNKHFSHLISVVDIALRYK